jgi:hypothetical protein
LPICGSEASLLLDTAPIVYVLEAHPEFASRFAPLFVAHAAGRLHFAVTTITIVEVFKWSAAGRQRRTRTPLPRGARVLAAG